MRRHLGGGLLIDTERFGECIFTEEEAEGAIPNGVMVRKCDGEFGDGTPLGTVGEVIGSVRHDEPLPDDKLAALPRRYRDTKIAYFVMWAGRPDEVVGVIDKKIEEA